MHLIRPQMERRSKQAELNSHIHFIQPALSTNLGKPVRQPSTSVVPVQSTSRQLLLECPPDSWQRTRSVDSSSVAQNAADTYATNTAAR